MISSVGKFAACCCFARWSAGWAVSFYAGFGFEEESIYEESVYVGATLLAANSGTFSGFSWSAAGSLLSGFSFTLSEAVTTNILMSYKS